VGEVGERDPGGAGAGHDDHPLSRPGQRDGVGEAPVAADGKTADEDVQRTERARGLLVGAVRFAQHVDRRGVEIDRPADRDRFEDATVDVAVAVEEGGRQEARQAGAGVEDLLRRAARPPPGDADVEVGRHHVDREGQIGKVGDGATASYESAQRHRRPQVIPSAQEPDNGAVAVVAEHRPGAQVGPQLAQVVDLFQGGVEGEEGGVEGAHRAPDEHIGVDPGFDQAGEDPDLRRPRAAPGGQDEGDFRR
jgi:hypothetical protein